MTRKLFTTIIFCLAGISYLPAQDVKLSAPFLQGHESKLYYFAGAEVDSLTTSVDASGKALFRIPGGNYRGMATLVVPGSGGIEFVVAEPSVQLECKELALNIETVNFSNSAENLFIKYIFTTQSRYLQQQAWLQAGSQLFDTASTFLSAIAPELKKVEDSMIALDNEIAASPLYSAKYFRLSEYMNSLFKAEQKQDGASALLIRQEMEESLDITSLYTSGRLWESILNFYISLFNQTSGEDKQQQYAASVLRTSQRLSAPFFEAYISGCITETERFGWNLAQDSILSKLLENYPGFTTSSSPLQRAIGSYLTRSNKSMPDIAGLSKADKVYTKTLITFYDSDCSSCINEVFRLITIYPQLQEKDIRVVSIAADMDEKRYEEGIRNFPWQDKLCDFKGFSGSNFSNYNVIGTPSFFLIDNNYKLLGQFYSVSDLEETVMN